MMDLASREIVTFLISICGDTLVQAKLEVSYCNRS